MVNKYKKKTNQGSWDKNVMQTAINLCKTGESVQGTAKKYGLAYSTLYRHVQSGNVSPKLGRFRPVFNEDQEIELMTCLKDTESVFFGLTRDEFKNLAYIYAKQNNLSHPNSWDKYRKAGDDWLQSFVSRHNDVTFRTPGATSVARAQGYFDRFPKYPHLNEIWKKFCNNQVTWTPKTTSTICSAHFTTADYRIHKENRRRLLKTSIPSQTPSCICPNHPVPQTDPAYYNIKKDSSGKFYKSTRGRAKPKKKKFSKTNPTKKIMDKCDGKNELGAN